MLGRRLRLSFLMPRNLTFLSLFANALLSTCGATAARRYLRSNKQLRLSQQRRLQPRSSLLVFFALQSFSAQVHFVSECPDGCNSYRARESAPSQSVQIHCGNAARDTTTYTYCWKSEQVTASSSQLHSFKQYRLNDIDCNVNVAACGAGIGADFARPPPPRSGRSRAPVPVG